MSERDLIERLRARRKCQRCDCLSCGREGMGELHDHVCTDGPDCIETREKLRAKNRNLRLLCGDAADALRDREATIARLSEALAEAEKKGAEEAERQSAYYGALVLCLDRYEEMASKANLDRLVDFIAEFQEAISDRAPLCKLNRWLGYIQGTLIGEEVTTVESERDWTRRLFRPLDFPAPPRDLSQGGQHG